MRAFAASLLLTMLCIAQAQSAGTHKHPGNTSAMAQHYGNGTPPVSPLTGMDNKPFSIESFKGHWTLLYYWADWCVPCIQEGIPELISFTNAHRARRDEFRIVAIRRNSNDEAGDWNDFHSKTEHLEQALWHTVPPFPIVWDSSAGMTSDWGIHELPTYALVDPQGNLVRGGNLSTLEVALQKHTK